MSVWIADRFELQQKIGEGTFAEVWRAIDTQAAAEAVDVALKIFRPIAAGDPEYCWEPVYREIAAGLQMASHANVLCALALTNARFFDEQETPCLVMKYIEGTNLALWLAGLERPGPASIEMRLTVMGDLLRGIAHAHASGVVHHDISFGNALIRNSRPYTALLSDFGASQTQNVVTSATAQDNNLAELQAINPPPYCQFSSLAEGARRDIYAFGTLCYLALTGRHPLTDDWQSMRAGAWHGKPDPHHTLPRRTMIDLSPWMKQSAPLVALSDLLLRCVSPEPSKRPLSATEVYADWIDVMSGLA